MPNKICLVVDASCDLSPEFISDNDIHIIPTRVLFDGREFIDSRDSTLTLAFYYRQLSRKGFEAETEPLTSQEMAKFFTRNLVLRHNRIQIMSINAKRSQIFERIHKMTIDHRNNFKELRKKAGIYERFNLQLLDTEAMFTGQAIIAHEAARLVNQENVRLSKLSPQLIELRKRVYSFIVPNDLYYLHSRAKKKGDKSVGWLSYKLGSMMDVKPIIQCFQGETQAVDKAAGFETALGKLLQRTKRAIEDGLYTPFIAMSYAGDIQDIKRYAPLATFELFAKNQGIETMLSVMSTTAAVNVGPGAFSIAFAVNRVK